MSALIDDSALLASESDDEDFDDEEDGERPQRNGNGQLDDSSEEEEDDDEEEAAKVAEGFIDDEDEDDEARRERRRERKKRKRAEREAEDEGLDEDDLDLIGIRNDPEDGAPRLKRLRQGRKEERARVPGVNDIFGDEEEDLEDRVADRYGLQRPAGVDDLDDFIEEDDLSDEEQMRRREEAEVARPRRRGLTDIAIAGGAGIDEIAMEDFRAAFGDGTDYDFALELEDQQQEAEAEKDRHLTLKDVFEPSQLAEKMLTDEDNKIMLLDEPERYQIARRPYEHIELTEQDFKEEALFIANNLWIKKDLEPHLREPFNKAVSQVLEFMVHDDFEPPFVFQHRRDHLIHAVRQQIGTNKDGTPHMVFDASKLLSQSDLWTLTDQDLKFRSFVEKRQAIRKSYDDIKSSGAQADEMFDSMLKKAQTIEELQDLQDYLAFQYSANLKDIAATTNGLTNGHAVKQRRANQPSIYDTIRQSKAYHIVRAYGMTADAFAKNVVGEGPRTYADDSTETPEALADASVDAAFPTTREVLKAARSMFVEELTTSPRLRGFVRQRLYLDSVIDVERTEAGLRRITEDHPYYEFKYLRNMTLPQIASRSEMFLKMLKAEDEKLIKIVLRLNNAERVKKDLYKQIVTDAYSTVADAWNEERRQIISTAFDRTVASLSRAVKENLQNESEDAIAAQVRTEFSNKLDQAPYQPRGMKKGTVPRVLTLSLGGGQFGRDPVYFAYISDDGRVLEDGQFIHLSPGNQERGLPDGEDVKKLIELIERREPEVIGVSGWTPETRKLYTNVETLIKDHNILGPEYADDDDRDRRDLVELAYVNDEVARQFQTSKKARDMYPGKTQLTLYCISLGKYLQDPMKEYAVLEKDLVSINFHAAQGLLPIPKLQKALETSFVDHVNMVGLDIDDILSDPASQSLLKYVAGMGPRKANHFMKTLNQNPGAYPTRESWITNDTALLTPKVWANAAATIYIHFEPADDQAEFLDDTRVHPEDYDIARKMAADALELDEEDIEQETREFGHGAIVRRLIREKAEDKVNDLVLDEYAVQLEAGYNARKRHTLENIRAELNDPHEEIRNPFIVKLNEKELFTMLTRETEETLQKGMNVPLTIKRVTEASVEGKLDCGLDAFAMEGEACDPNLNPKNLYAPHQTVQAHIINVDSKAFMCVVSLLESKTKKPFRRGESVGYDHWDHKQEDADRKKLDTRTDSTGRAIRVIKHPLFKAFNSRQAEEYLGSMNRGDLVIRPSSKGNDHLAVTWKVSAGVFQHIDVLELGKENDFTLGTKLRVGGKYQYTDLDHLIVEHVKAMARKVDEMMSNDKFQDKSKSQLDEWLTTYCNANPKRSNYQFCIDREHPGYFHLAFKAGQKADLMAWPVKITPYGYELQKQPYADMRNLCNGFKLLWGNIVNSRGSMPGVAR